MKVRNIVLPFIMLVTFVFTLGGLIPSAHAHGHNEDNGVIEHSHETLNEESEYVDEETALSILEEDAIDAMSIICCEPNSPKEVTTVRSHVNKSSTSCVLLGQNITKCLSCGAITAGKQVEINTHNPQLTPGCPFK